MIAYKVTRPDGRDFRSGTVDYRDAVGWDLEIYDEPQPPKLCTSSVLHASPTLLDAIGYGRLPCAVFEVEGDPVVSDATKAGFVRLTVRREIVGVELDELAGFKLREAMAPVHPFHIEPDMDGAVELLGAWASVWASVRASVRGSVWDSVWDSVRGSVWDSVWDSVRDSVWDSVRDSVWDSVRDSVWDSVRGYTGSLFPGVQAWRYVDHAPGVYPFQSAVDLWHKGLVPVFDGRVWRLHGRGGVMWEDA